ncbi:MAG TPA: hypothetical protein VFP92_03330 [Rhodanobacteraceae bacterium]|nr:hypothetical protein [Rhodanobacteraceae bacterium]
MNKLLLGTTLATLCGAATFAFPASAQQASANAQADTSTATADHAATTPKVKRAVSRVDSRMCIRHTGSHIPPPKGQCLPVAGNSYTQQDIQRTGATNVGRALQMLDPSVMVHGH